MATIDTLAYVKELESAGIDRSQAEAHAKAMKNHVLPELVSSSDLRHAVTELKVWMITSMLTVAGFAIAVAKLL